MALEIEMLHPPLKAPVPPPKSSTTYKLQTPFGAVPPKTEASVAVPIGGGLMNDDGAGAGKLSPAILSVGLYVPETMVAGTCVGAASSNVSVMLETDWSPPTSESSSMARPAGLTSSTSTSVAKICWKPLNVTVILSTVLGTPVTLMVEGYGVAGATSLIVI